MTASLQYTVNGNIPYTTVWCETCQNTFLYPHTCPPPYLMNSPWCPTCQSAVLTYPHVCPAVTKFTISGTTCYDQYGAEVPPDPLTCPAVNVDISRPSLTPTLETRVLQLEARILDLQDFIEQLTARIGAQENK